MGRAANRKWQRRVRRYIAETKLAQRLEWSRLFGRDRRFSVPVAAFNRNVLRQPAAIEVQPSGAS